MIMTPEQAALSDICIDAHGYDAGPGYSPEQREKNKEIARRGRIVCTEVEVANPGSQRLKHAYIAGRVSAADATATAQAKLDLGREDSMRIYHVWDNDGVRHRQLICGGSALQLLRDFGHL